MRYNFINEARNKMSIGERVENRTHLSSNHKFKVMIFWLPPKK